MIAARQREIFDAALDIVNEAERCAMLDSACAGDAALRAQVDGLLAAHAKSDEFFSNFASVVAEQVTAEFLQSSAQSIGGVSVNADEVGSRIGPYTLLQKLGEGGCGAVYLADQESPVRRRVALKIIKLGMDTKTVIARFGAEQQALALMDHPNIARVLDAGVTQLGRPFFVMELVRGKRITEYCDEHQLNLRQRLKLFIQVCHAIQHAHQKGIIHRDIKPTNVLVSEHDGIASPKVIDFGIAKAIEGKLSDEGTNTAQGLFVGTPAYMSPEQAQMSGIDVDTRSDIYSLGVLLYELLIGKTPFDQQKLLDSGLDKMRRTITDQEPPRPSQKAGLLSEVELVYIAQRRQVDPSRLQSELKGDLDWVVMKTIEKDRSRRYQTANGLALDVRRFLDNEPVSARPPSRFYYLQKLARRNVIVFVSIGIVAVTLVAGIVVSTNLWLRERESRRQLLAEQQQKIALQQQATLLDSLRRNAEEGRRFAEAIASYRQGKLEKADDLLDVISNFKPSLDDVDMFRQIGDWDAQQGRWSKALNRFSTLIQLNQQTNSASFLDDFRMAVILVDQGESAKYDSFRLGIIKRYADNADPMMAGRVLRLSLLNEADERVLALLKPFKDRTVKLLQGDDAKTGVQITAWCAYSLALESYRARNYNSATNWCAVALASDQSLPYRDVCVQLIQVMALARLGDLESAQSQMTALREKVANINNDMGLNPKQWHGYWFDWAIVRILLRETDHLLGNDTETAE